MAQETNKVTVIYRKYADGSILALMPGLPADARGHVTSYQHLGQHGAAEYAGCVRATRPATPVEYASLHRELMSLGYQLTIRQRNQRRK